jgi:hypothetical protein
VVEHREILVDEAVGSDYKHERDLCFAIWLVLTLPTHKE